MKNLVEPEKHGLARTILRAAEHLPALKRMLKGMVGIKYFMPPVMHLKGIKHFLILPEKQSPEMRYPVVEERHDYRKIVIITGATSGIGKAFAHHFARQGYDLLITGRRRSIINSVAHEIRREYGVQVKVVIADLAVKEDLSSFLQIIDRQRNIEVLVNNAGYGMNRGFSEDEIGHQLAMMNVHVNAPLILIHKVLPQMIKKRNGTIINVSSMAAYFPASGSVMYTSTKSFLKSFSESLFLDVGRYGIRVQCLCPGFTNSDFHRDLNIQINRINNGLLPFMEPSDVVQYSVKCLEKGRVVCVPGFINRLLIILLSVIPRSLYYRFSLRLEKKVRRVKENTTMPVLQ
ncbi:MAG: SDR family NAD(P)-dependent oxidoreductase [Bacteroidales bacterium]|nr:SDR family NAD(P)-dependent oxidoreductase [Bacteroidales bacterium]MBN2761462.1 SDR family NAD(P)-dependent oxidoreductase [Bacteroidales bacterium]